MVAPAIILGLRGVQVLLSIIVLGLTAYLIDTYRGPFDFYDWSPASVDFMLFCSIWTLLAVAYLVLVPTRFPKFAHKFAIAAVEFITMVFWFAAFVAVAVRWNNSWWGYDGRHGTFYGCGVAAIVFSAFLWLTFLATTILSALHIRSSSRNDTAPPPNMAGV
ncbi:marvel domain-containing protein [Phaeosphaeria sp. MPI-PUGE-AT-0046c]|nr:marvel domain-containing protein [Phaeosphaeria sp. MPI-PUGE-AT-0046c]